jgi:hypothetical protein
MTQRDEGTGQFMPGASGNAKGRPKGARNRLGEDFLSALADDFEQHGTAAIQQVRQERPHEYLKVIAGILPKELKVQSSTDGMSEEQIDERIRQIASGLGIALGDERDDEPRAVSSFAH